MEVEAALNYLILTYVYNDLREPLPLRTLQFLNFARADSTFVVNFKEIIGVGSSRSSLMKMKKYQDLLVKQLWCKCKKQYIMDLRSVHALKNPNQKKNIRNDDIVLIEGDDKSKCFIVGNLVMAICDGRLSGGLY
ncbi:hypothetical protein AVEN_188241-1 [Araneus ventricosus]|uniref:DUF5641 domain-containing protein n=1 Tax=Araneus ventricosus TaxID=182803 RepID=A0A4Y2IRD2_ARAVE|nr:hypothetical protein AVEN_188241-1 [Araneus ventricosus]